MHKRYFQLDQSDLIIFEVSYEFLSVNFGLIVAEYFS